MRLSIVDHPRKGDEEGDESVNAIYPFPFPSTGCAYEMRSSPDRRDEYDREACVYFPLLSDGGCSTTRQDPSLPLPLSGLTSHGWDERERDDLPFFFSPVGISERKLSLGFLVTHILEG